MAVFNKSQWALVLGGSSGFGLAAAKKLSQEGMSVCVAHRDRRGAMKRIEEEFEIIRAHGNPFVSVNVDALAPEGQDKIIASLKEVMEEGDKIKMVLHSIAFGNLKPIAPYKKNKAPAAAVESLAQRLGIDEEKLKTEITDLMEHDNPALFSLLSPDYTDRLIEDEDMVRTIYSMGTSLLSWTQRLYADKFFARDARVIGLTSEGNKIAWRGYTAVSAAKVALESVSRSIALEFAPYGIRSNIVQAGVTDTPALRAIPGNERMKAFAKLRNPFGRLTQPEDVANVISLLCMDEASWINGTIICADGGEQIASY
jgi:NAD(P)-dependent dehydrogenase (short-subunit alcohol dehydrogenase family)